MALPSNGRLSFSDIVGEFGGVAPHKLSEYYGQGGVPASGRLKFSDFYGKSAFTPTHSLTIGRDNALWGYIAGGVGALIPSDVGGTNASIFTMDNGQGYDRLLLNVYEPTLQGKTMRLTFEDGSVFTFTNLPASNTNLLGSDPSPGFSQYIIDRYNQTVSLVIEVM